jgi:hypothetical protein
MQPLNLPTISEVVACRSLRRAGATRVYVVAQVRQSVGRATSVALAKTLPTT